MQQSERAGNVRPAVAARAVALDTVHIATGAAATAVRFHFLERRQRRRGAQEVSSHLFARRRQRRRGARARAGAGAPSTFARDDDSDDEAPAPAPAPAPFDWKKAFGEGATKPEMSDSDDESTASSSGDAREPVDLTEAYNKFAALFETPTFGFHAIHRMLTRSWNQRKETSPSGFVPLTRTLQRGKEFCKTEQARRAAAFAKLVQFCHDDDKWQMDDAPPWEMMETILPLIPEGANPKDYTGAGNGDGCLDTSIFQFFVCRRAKNIQDTGTRFTQAQQRDNPGCDPRQESEGCPTNQIFFDPLGITSMNNFRQLLLSAGSGRYDSKGRFTRQKFTSNFVRNLGWFNQSDYPTTLANGVCMITPNLYNWTTGVQWMLAAYVVDRDLKAASSLPLYLNLEEGTKDKPFGILGYDTPLVVPEFARRIFPNENFFTSRNPKLTTDHRILFSKGGQQCAQASKVLARAKQAAPDVFASLYTCQLDWTKGTELRMGNLDEFLNNDVYTTAIAAWSRHARIFFKTWSDIPMELNVVHVFDPWKTDVVVPAHIKEQVAKLGWKTNFWSRNPDQSKEGTCQLHATMRALMGAAHGLEGIVMPFTPMHDPDGLCFFPVLTRLLYRGKYRGSSSRSSTC